jgi:endonuclease III-like uncharacterized protein
MSPCDPTLATGPRTRKDVAQFERRLPPDPKLFQEYHGLIVWTGKDFCRRKPRCDKCPLECTLRKGQPLLEE